LRIDKLSLAALEATLRLYRDPQRAGAEIPVLAMLDRSEEALAASARRLCDGIGTAAEPIRTVARAGGGSLPLTELDGPAVALRTAVEPELLAARLRAHDPPVIARIHDGRVVLDPRTLAGSELDVVVQAVRDALDE
jgi:L-seryl-tRNA(Ser) seleniumtransferase